MSVIRVEGHCPRCHKMEVVKISTLDGIAGTTDKVDNSICEKCWSGMTKEERKNNA